MVANPRDNFRRGFKYYVPNAQYASDLQLGMPCLFSLGSPAAVSANNIAATIDADAVATTEESYATDAINAVLDGTYGRTLRMTPSGDPGNAFAIDVYGWDYLMQPMVERFTGASGSTGIIYGKKAFKYLLKTKIVTAATNAITAALGTGWRVGLPYKGDVEWAKENGVLVPLFNRDFIETRDLAAADVAGGASGRWIRAQFPGFVKTLIGTPNMAVGSTNDPVITVELGGVAIVGLTVTVDTSAGNVGTTVTDAPTTAGYSANNRFRAGDLIEIVVADADSSGAVTVQTVLTPTQFTHPDTTDPATVSTGDPRGTYEPIMTPDGSELIVGLRGDPSTNASENGGLHGIQHYHP